MIRLATINDLEPIVKLVKLFFEPFLASHGMPVNDNDVRNVSLRAISGNQVLVIVHDNQVQGVAAWECVCHPANHSLKLFYETIWCVRSKFKTDTLLLLRALQREAKAQKADLLLMANLSDEHEAQIKRILLKRGFNFLESHYSKTMKGE